MSKCAKKTQNLFNIYVRCEKVLPSPLVILCMIIVLIQKIVTIFL